MVTVKVLTTGTCGLTALQVWKRAVIDTVLLWLPQEMYGNNLIGCKCIASQKDFETFLVG